MHRRAFALVLGAVFVIGSLGVPADARDQGNLGILSPENLKIQEEFPPLVGTYPSPDAEGESQNPFAAFRPPTCRTVTYCDSIEVDVTYPDNFLDEVFFGVRITVTWDNPRTQDNPNGNDVDLFLWPDDGPVSGGPSSKCGSPNTQDSAHDCDYLEKEVITIFGPEDTEPEKTGEEDQPPLFFTVVNDEGLNTGYTFTAEFFTFDNEFEEFGEFEVPDREATIGTDASTAATSDESSPSDTGGPTGVQGPDEEEPRTVLVPGSDGELVEMDLPVLAAGQDIEPAGDTGLFTPITWAVIAAILLGAGAAFGVLHRRRRTAEGDLY